MSVAAGKLFLAAGLGLIVFSGYQAMSCESPGEELHVLEYNMFLHLKLIARTCRARADRETLRLTQEEFQGLPLSIAALLVAAAALSLVGALQSSGELQPISLADNPQ
jgi:hypothetical protein